MCRSITVWIQMYEIADTHSPCFPAVAMYFVGKEAYGVIQPIRTYFSCALFVYTLISCPTDIISWFLRTDCCYEKLCLTQLMHNLCETRDPSQRQTHSFYVSANVPLSYLLLQLHSGVCLFCSKKLEGKKWENQKYQKPPISRQEHYGNVILIICYININTGAKQAC